MNPEIVQIKEDKTIVGLELKDAQGQLNTGTGKNVLFHFMWVSLCPRFKEIEDLVDPEVIYAVWHRPDPNNSALWHRVVGAEVSKSGQLPDGMVSVRIPAGRYVTVSAAGGSHQIPRGLERIRKWIKEHNLVTSAVAFEKYDSNQLLDENYRVEVYTGIK
jgi:predicted transcriptional regulator YdeE